MDAKSFLLSRTIWGALLSFVAIFLKSKGIELDVEGWTTDIIAAVGIGLTIYGRVKATVPLKVK